ncbi:2-hydroxychromene-2-carboxylate isomerase [Loktanella sp. D2R18]|uniref:2-hydroxychromene-2-carboxylate isomerase n=1 Tax=Rhodobacterales TaxID=204455 RepID=UPI000DEB7070|nr:MULTISPECIES: 2-hydroxychromene-2-carboxylate isomerase [Rhodobacterales]MDO6591273.1 2-hydroxychromene-2-carboxylate isomerase [Yoonia sp. 1_MG-2023]RBW46227.1 2-hydroxychromene-2-carboxylate isomerase [Loktanella sp. D2R18]
MAHIDYFFATISPFSYLCGQRPGEIAAKHGATITYRPLDIMSLFARTGGTAPKDRHPSRMEYRAQELRRQTAQTGMPLNPKPAFWPTNPAPSSYAIIAAQNEGGDVAGLVHAIGAACWAEEKDISQDDVIRECLTKTGFAADLADKHMLTSAETYAANLEDAVANGAFGAPFFITDTDERFWGQDRLDALDVYLGG